MRDVKVQLVLQMVQSYLNFKEQRPEREDSATAYLVQINISDWSEMLRCDGVFLEDWTCPFILSAPYVTAE